MKMYRVGVASIAVVLLLINPVYAANTSGLVEGLWFDSSPVTDFTEITVYSVVHNQTNTTLEGIATLLVDGAAVGAQDVRVGSNDIKRVGISYLFKPGTYTVLMRFTPGKGATVTSSELAASTITVIADTDGDGIENSRDNDDDNDGILDTIDRQPLVSDAPQDDETSLSDTGRAFLERITRDNDEDTDNIEEAAETTDTGGVVGAIDTLEDARKRGALAAREREEERREAIDEITRLQSEVPEDSDAAISYESKIREHQIAAAAHSVTGTVLDHGWMFYAHIAVLIGGVMHLFWGWFRSNFAPLAVRTEEDEPDYDEDVEED